MFHQVINSRGSHYSGIIYDGFVHGYNFHNSFELIYIISGKLDVMINTHKVVMHENEFVIISPSVAHAIDNCENCKYFISIFTQDYVTEFFNNTPGFSFYHFTVDDVLLSFFKQHMLYPEKRNRYMLKACTYALCSSATEKNLNKNTQQTDHGFIFNVNKYISENFKFDITRKEIASALNYEEHYFSHLFSKNMNMTFKKYINIYRFALAQNLIVSSKKNVTQIATECGFKSVRSFNDVFKELSGITPTEYRKKQK